MDIRLFKEILKSTFHNSFSKFFNVFIDGYQSVNSKELEKILQRIDIIESRKRYAVTWRLFGIYRLIVDFWHHWRRGRNIDKFVLGR